MENQFSTSFRNYVCEGDTISADVEGFTVTARIVRDDCGDKPDQRDDGFWPSKNKKDAGYVLPHNYDEQMQRAEQVMKAWKNDEWFYCGIVLSVSKDIEIAGRTQDEVILSDHAASLWGIEANYPDSDNSYLTTVANELLSEALEHAKECFKQIAA